MRLGWMQTGWHGMAWHGSGREGMEMGRGGEGRRNIIKSSRACQGAARTVDEENAAGALLGTGDHVTM